MIKTYYKLLIYLYEFDDTKSKKDGTTFRERFDEFLKEISKKVE